MPRVDVRVVEVRSIIPAGRAAGYLHWAIQPHYAMVTKVLNLPQEVKFPAGCVVKAGLTVL